MKLNTLFLSLFVILLFTQCGSDDDNNNSNQNQFTINNASVYNVSHAYLVLDHQPGPFTNGFMLSFLNGKMRQDNVNGASIHNSTTHGISVQVMFGGLPVPYESDITDRITNGAVFTPTDETAAITDIYNYEDPYTYMGETYGEPDEDTAILYELGLTGNGTLTLNSFTVDLIARTGNLDCNYTFTDENSNTIVGNYSGSFEIINAF